MSKSDGVAWRNSRTYTPKIIRDGNIYKMWFTGRDIATGNYAIGYATSPISPSTDTLYIREVSAGTVGLPAGVTSLVFDENEILNASASVSSASAGIISVAGSPRPLSSFTSGDLGGVDLTTPKDIGGKSVLVGKAVKVSSGISGTPIRFINPNIPTVIVSIPDATVALASSGWNGTVTTPKWGTTSGDTPPVGFSIGTAVDIGSSEEVLLFDKPIQVTLGGITGSVGYKPSGSTIWTRITTTCGGTYASPTLSAAEFPGECSISDGTDTKILSYHLTTFGGLVPVAPEAPAQTPSGGGSKSGGITPYIGVLSVPSPLNLPGGPGLVTYTYTVTNVGAQQSLTDVTVVDDVCSPVKFISGDTNGNTKLDPTEKWKYSCATTLSKTTTNTATVIGRGDDTGRTHAIAISLSTVVIGAPVIPPLINVIKIPSQLTPFQQEGGDVTYTYTVANPGIIAMNDVSVSDDNCSPVTLLSGDTNSNTLLDTEETWVYSCQAHVATSTRGVATVQGQGKGLTALGYAFTNVLVQSEASSTPLTSGALGSFVPVIIPGQKIKDIATTLVQGNYGEKVRVLQQFLILQQGPKSEALKAVGVTGYFGALTRAALAEFQTGAGISPSLGNFGPITRAYIQAH